MLTVQRSLIFLKQYKTVISYNRNQHTNISEKNYCETLKMESSKKFPYNNLTMSNTTGTEDEVKDFESTLPGMITSFVDSCTDVPELKECYTELLQEHVGKDKQASGFLVNAVYKILAAPEKLTPENIKLANILGCCCNVPFAMDTVIDDAAESSEYRFGKPCWYKRHGASVEVVNDAIFLDNGLYVVLKKYFSGFSSYVPIVECFHDAGVCTTMGRHLDDILAGNGKPRLELFSMDKYKTMIRYRITPFAYMLPMMTGTYLAEKFDSDLHKHIYKIVCEMGMFFGVQNDILDCYGDPLLTGKEDVDIARGKCSWLAVKALEQGTLIQKQILREHYGKSKRESKLKVRNVYDELQLLDQYLEWEKRSFETALQAAQKISNDKYRQGFYKIVESVYKQDQ